MLLAVVICSLAVAATVSGLPKQCAYVKCNNTGLIKYYKELACTPVQPRWSCCPSKFDCSAALNHESYQCYLQGRVYTRGQKLTPKDTGDACQNCQCQVDDYSAKLECVSSECPEDMSNRSVANDCFRVYSHDSCCSTGVSCKYDIRTACISEGKTYQLGQSFYPEKNPCLKCICQEGFDGTLKEPWCKEVSCGIEIHYQDEISKGCAPIFRKDSCCPIGFRCPKTTDRVLRTHSKPAKGFAHCEFGTFRLKIGDMLNTETPCVECKCTLPPYLSCVRSRHC